MFKLRSFRWRAVLAAVLVIGLITSPGAALAYNAAGACSYADRYALSPNPNYPSFPADCTNFVSQCLHEGGGVPFDISGLPQWYCYKSIIWYYTNEWTVAENFWQWLINDGHGQNLGFQGAYPQSDNNPNTIPGDVFLYNWHALPDTIFDHASINAAYGKDINSGRTGDLVDQHTSNRLQAIWHLIPYNDNRYTIRIYAARPY